MYSTIFFAILSNAHPLESIINNKKLKWPQEMIKYGALRISLKDLKPLFEVLPTSDEILVNLDAAF